MIKKCQKEVFYCSNPIFTVKFKINDLWTSPPNFSSIRPWTKRHRTFDEIWAWCKKPLFFSLILFLSNDYPKLKIRSPSLILKIHEPRTSPSNFNSIGPRTKWDRTFDEIWAWWEKPAFFSLLLSLSNDFLKLQIRSSPFRLKINESRNSPPNFSSIGPRTKWDQTFDEIWAWWEKLAFFSLLFFLTKNGGSLPSFLSSKS